MEEKSAKVPQSKWVLDSGATNHMSSDYTQFQHITHIQTPIHIAYSAMMMVEGEGDLFFILMVTGVKNPVILNKVL